MKIGRTLRSARTFPDRLGGFGSLLSDGVDYIVAQAQNAAAAAGAATSNAINDFRSKYAQFQQAYAQFQASRSDALTVGMGTDYDDMASVFSKVDAMVQGSLRAYNNFVEAAQDVGQATADYYYSTGSTEPMLYGLGRVGLRGLGIAPIVAAAVVAGLVAAIIYALSKYADYSTKLLNLKAQLVREGKLPASSLDQSFIGDTASLVKWGVIGAAFLLLWGPVIKPQLAKLKRHG
jgi:hypothetical protein